MDPLNGKVFDLIENGKAGTARRLIRARLGGRISKKRRILLLELLLNLELLEEKLDQAQTILSERQALGFETPFDAFDSALLAASLMVKRGKWVAARNEMAKLLMDPGTTQWPSLLEALHTFVLADERSRRPFSIVLERAYTASLELLGIPSPGATARPRIRSSVKEAHCLFKSASRNHQRLVLKALDAQTQDSRDALIDEIRKSISIETVGYFRDQGEKLILNLSTISREKKPE